MKRIFIIAEAGVNHNGSIEIAKKLILEAKASGADAIKFQTFKAKNIVSESALKAEYQKKTTEKSETQYHMIKKLELTETAHLELKNYCQEIEITFLSSPFDREGVKFLNKLGLSTFKIPSGEITNIPYLKEIGSLNKNVLMSTGMANLGEIETALNILQNAGTPLKNITFWGEDG